MSALRAADKKRQARREQFAAVDDRVQRGRQGDTHREMRADARLLETNAEVAKRWWGRMFGPRRRDPAAPRQVGLRPADEGGEARRKET